MIFKFRKYNRSVARTVVRSLLGLIRLGYLRLFDYRSLGVLNVDLICLDYPCNNFTYHH